MKIVSSLVLGVCLMGSSLQASEVLHLANKSKTPLVYEESKSLPIVSMQVVFTMAGSIEDGKKAGLARIVAKLLGEGTKAKGSSAFALALESKAIHISAHTGTETFVFEISSLKSEFSTAIGFLKELLQDPNFTQAQLDKVKTSVKGSLLQSENNFDSVAKKALKGILFEGTALASPSSGTIESVDSITIKDVQTFFKINMTQANAIGVMGGDISTALANTYLGEIVSVLPKGKAKDMVKIAVRKTPKSITLKRDTKQAYIYFGSPFNLGVDSPDYYKARVGMFILGTGGFGTRLMEEIRVKRGLAYSAYARMSINRSHHYMTGYLQTKLESANEALTVVKDEIAKFVKKGVTQKELDAAREFLLGSEPLRTETLSQRLSRTFMSYYKGQPLDYAQQELKKIDALGLDELNAFIKEHTELNDLSVVILTK